MREAWRTLLDDEAERWFDALWGKSGRDADASGNHVANLLVQHLLDSFAMGELLWDRYLAPGPRQRLDDLADGRGRQQLSWLCGLHDVGKASPAFQGQNDELARAVDRAGLRGAVAPRRNGQRWRHELAGGFIVRSLLSEAWSDQEQVDWVWPMVAGHHGRVPEVGEITLGRGARGPSFHRKYHGTGAAWEGAQRALVLIVTSASGYADLAEAQPVARPSRADQLLLSGLVIMADWIASSSEFPGVASLADVSIAGARSRAERAWTSLQLRGGWQQLDPPRDVIAARFHRVRGIGETHVQIALEARPVQIAAVEAARTMAAPGLLVIEAPTGEGKTEAALGAAEVLAARFGASGVFVGLPTQATSDPMFTRVRDWLSTFDDPSSIVLLHGRRRFNDEWKRMVEHKRKSSPDASVDEMDEFDLVDHYGVGFSCVGIDGGGDHDCGTDAAAEWFLGSKRGLLAANGVGTIDHVLYAGSRTKHVMLRYAGLAGKVVVLDEVHAADVYMSQFLVEALTWLGSGQVPVVLLSATVAPAQREALVASYLKGSLGVAHVEVPWARGVDGYPVVTSVWSHGTEARHATRATDPRQEAADVRVVALPTMADDPDSAVVALVEERLSDGGSALVIRNTVRRAIDTYDALVERFPHEDVVLLHSRFSAADRARRTETLLAELGPKGVRRRRRVVVATQVAEQSFDIDADLLVTDIAPVDLLVQRAGRVHRHDDTERPAKLASALIAVTGFDLAGSAVDDWESGTITFPRGSEFVYGRHLLLRSAVQVLRAAHHGGWRLPTDVPRLVAECYGDDEVVPDGWSAVAAGALRKHLEVVADRQANAAEHVLTPAGRSTAPTLAGVQAGGGTRGAEAESVVRVRDGEQGPEVVLVRRDDHGYAALDGTPLGPNADAGRQHIDAVLGGTVRIPAHELGSSAASFERLGTLPAWRDDPWLGRVAVVVLDCRLAADLDGCQLRYDPDRGLRVGRT